MFCIEDIVRLPTALSLMGSWVPASIGHMSLVLFAIEAAGVQNPRREEDVAEGRYWRICVPISNVSCLECKIAGTVNY